jgi:uncharacterized membrane protein (DUF4010 family)
MYLRILVVVAVFNLTLARQLAPSLCGLSLAALAICALQYWFSKPAPQETKSQTSTPQVSSKNPLELGPAALFAGLFVLVSFVSKWTTTEFGISGIYSLAAVVGITDIDPFVLNLAQGGAAGVPNSALAAAILIAASSNNILKAVYAACFAGGRATAGSAAALVLLAVAGVTIAIATGGL